MGFIIKLINKILAKFDWELRRRAKNSVRYDNFANLATAYELKLSSNESSIQKDTVRPKLLARLLGTPPSEAYFIVQALHQCKDLAGDVCEFGVAQGETSALIANEIARLENKRFHLFDSFEGLPQPTDKDQLIDDIFSLGSMEAYAGTMSCPEDMVRSRLKAIDFPNSRFTIHKGFIEASLNNNPSLPSQVSFAYVDFDFYEPIQIALDFLHGISPSGAVFIVDDYGFFSSGAKTAVEEFIESHPDQYNCFVPDEALGHFAVLTKKS
jgi:O-methyltransferase